MTKKHIPKRYNLDNFFQCLQSPRKVANEVRKNKKINSYLWKKAFIHKYKEPTNVMEKDWDNLVILDACRYDIFEELNTFEEKVDRITSHGSHSLGFIRENFKEGTHHDTIYVTGNGNAEVLDGDEFFKIVKTYADHNRRYQGWMPNHVNQLALNAYESHKNKRIIVHFMQPHTPYIGEKANKLRKSLAESHNLNFKKFDILGMKEKDVQKNWKNNLNSTELPSLLDAAKQGYIDTEVLRDIYKENLEIVLNEVEKFVADTSGKTVITSDHGELLGDQIGNFTQKQYGHHQQVWTPELRNVPWLELKYDSRRLTEPEEPIGSSEVEKKTVEANLEALGYM